MKTFYELRRWIGKTYTMHICGFDIVVRVHDARSTSDGNVELFVAPLAGNGTVWVSCELLYR